MIKTGNGVRQIFTAALKAFCLQECQILRATNKECDKNLLTILSIPTYDKTIPFSFGPSLKYSIATIENIDWKIPNGIPQIHFIASRYATFDMLRILAIRLTLNTDDSSFGFSKNNKENLYEFSMRRIITEMAKQLFWLRCNADLPEIELATLF